MSEALSIASPLVASAASGAGSALVAGLVLRLPEALWRRLVPYAISLAAGSLLGVTFFDLLPHLSHALPDHGAFKWILGGILGFHLLERMMLWRHCHEPACSLHQGTRLRILVGDGLHNFVDGVALAAAFQVSPGAGWALAQSVAAHELPQEVGDLALLVESGLSRRRAFGWNLLSSLAAVAGTGLGLLAMQVAEGLEPYLLAITTASFLNLALSDLLPLHRDLAPWSRFLRQGLCLLAGIALLAWLSGGHSH